MITNIPPSPPQYDEFGRLIMSPQQIMPAPVQPPVQQPVQAPIPVQQQSTPNFNPIPHLQMAPATPAQEQNIPLPTPDQFHNSRLRTVLNAIAGGFAGAAAGPKVGFEVGQNLAQAPYNRAMQTYDTKVADQKRRLGIEGERMKRSEFESSEGVKRGTAQSLDESRTEKALTDAKKTNIQERAQTTKELDQTSKDKRRQASIEHDKWKEAHPNLSDTQWLFSLKPEDQADAIEMLRDKTEATRKPEKDLAAISAEAQARAEGTIAGGGTPGSLQAAAASTTAKAQAQENVKTDPANIKREADLARAKSLATLSSNEKDTIRGAQIALQALPDIRAQLPTASDKIFGNRWQDFLTGTIGKDPEFAPLRENIGLLQSLVAKLHVGSRGSVHILNKFETLFNAKQMDRDTLASSINELEKWLVRYASAAPGTTPDKVPQSERPPIMFNDKVVK